MSKFLAIVLFVVFILLCIVIVRFLEEKVKNMMLKNVAYVCLAMGIAIVVLIFLNFVFGS